MDVKRRKIRNELNSSIKETKSYINRSNDTINRLRYATTNVEFNTKQIEKLKVYITEKKELLNKYNKELNNLDLGILDEKINKEIADNKKVLREKELERKRIKKQKKEEKEEKKEKSQNYWKDIVADSRGARKKKRDIAYGWKHFNRSIDSLPGHMKKNLEEMPNNKGYIWRGVRFYGELESQRGQPDILFEKNRGTLIIHEYTTRNGIREYRRYEKNGKERKRLTENYKTKVKNIYGTYDIPS